MRKSTLLLFIILIISACSDSYEKRNFYAMGTLVEITHKKGADLKPVIKTINEYEADIKSFEEKFNNAENGTSLEVSVMWESLFKKASNYKALSKDRFDIRAFSLTSLYGFPEGPYFIPTDEQKAEVVDSLLTKPLLFLDEKLFKDNKNIKISTGAFSKGFIVDMAVEKMIQNGEKAGIVNAGGDLFAFGKKNKASWKIGIKNPEDQTEILSIINLSNKGIATSGDYERYFIHDNKRYNHIFDMVTMKSANFYKSVSVIAKSCEEADGLSTVFFLLPETEIAEACKRSNTPVLVYTNDGRVLKFCGWEKFES